ncbi:hypothetical protein QZH41_006179 [Actinostola sp. cb2023]|nr:hypothetical protein QZH41_006179 [Actinostola sp. cb2023]
MSQGEYEMVISDYSRAKSLFAETDIKIFKKVLQEVETKIESFKNFLKSKLQEFPWPLDEQKKIIRYLVELDYVGDPAWECLINQHAWLLKLLSSCRDDHQSKATFRPDSPSLGKAMLSSGSKPSTLDRQFRSSQVTPQRVQFVEELSELVTETLPDLWKLGQAYFSQTLLGESMIQQVASLYTNLVSTAFFVSSLTKLDKYSTWSTNIEGLAAWLPSCVRNTSSSQSVSELLDHSTYSLDDNIPVNVDRRFDGDI